MISTLEEALTTGGLLSSTIMYSYSEPCGGRQSEVSEAGVRANGAEQAGRGG